MLACLVRGASLASAAVLPQVPDVLIDPTSVTRCFRITKQIGLLATGLGRECLRLMFMLNSIQHHSNHKHC
jgi:hypothetical protein